MCNLTRAAPGEYTKGCEGKLTVLPSTAVAVPFHRIDGGCANESGSDAHNRKRAVRKRGDCPSNLAVGEGTNENVVHGPMPDGARRLKSGELLTNLAIAEWENSPNTTTFPRVNGTNHRLRMQVPRWFNEKETHSLV